MDNWTDIDEEKFKVLYLVDGALQFDLTVRNRTGESKSYKFTVGNGDCFTDTGALTITYWIMVLFPVILIPCFIFELIRDFSVARIAVWSLAIAIAEFLAIGSYKYQISWKKERTTYMKELLDLKNDSPDQRLIRRMFSLIEEYCPKGTMEKIRSLA